MMTEADEPNLEDLEEGECSDEEEEAPPPPQTKHDQPAHQEPVMMETDSLPDQHDLQDRHPSQHDQDMYPPNAEEDNYLAHAEHEDRYPHDEQDSRYPSHPLPHQLSADGNMQDALDDRSRRESGAERKHKKHKRHRSKSKDREKKHKKHKKRDREEYDPEDEKSKKKFMLKKLKALEGEMGLVPSEEEFEEEKEPEETRKPPRYCNLYMQGKCPRDAKDCLFSHDIEVPKVWELCKFYILDRCAKRDKCLYLHKEFPCKYYHLGFECAHNHVTCKFSHKPLNPKTKNLLIKHVEAAPKDLLGNFPRLSRQEAMAAIMKTEAANYTRWNSMQQEDWSDRPDFLENMENPAALGGNIQTMLNMMTMLKNNIEQKIKNKPADLMSIRLDEHAVKKKLHSQSSPNTDETPPPSIQKHDSFGDVENDAGRGSGDETPDVTPPVSPGSRGDLEIDTDGESNRMRDSSGDHHMLTSTSSGGSSSARFRDPFLRRDRADSSSSGDAHMPRNRNDSTSSDPRDTFKGQVGRSMSLVDQQQEGSPHDQLGWSPQQQGWSPMSSHRRNSSDLPSKPDENGGDPRIKSSRTDPRKEKRARKEQEELRVREEERLEKEKEQRMLDLDLGSVLGDLDLPPLSVSDDLSNNSAYPSLPPLPKSEDFLATPTSPDKLGGKNDLSLPFKPHVYNVAREIEASLHSHDPILWILRPVDVARVDYSPVLHYHSVSQSQLDLDPRLRRYKRGGGAAAGGNGVGEGGGGRDRGLPQQRSPRGGYIPPLPSSPVGGVVGGGAASYAPAPPQSPGGPASGLPSSPPPGGYNPTAPPLPLPAHQQQQKGVKVDPRLNRRGAART